MAFLGNKNSARTANGDIFPASTSFGESMHQTHKTNLPNGVAEVILPVSIFPSFVDTFGPTVRKNRDTRGCGSKYFKPNQHYRQQTNRKLTIFPSCRAVCTAIVSRRKVYHFFLTVSLVTYSVYRRLRLLAAWYIVNGYIGTE